MPQENRRTTSNLLAAMAIGAGCMYLLDPVNGKRRRRLIRDRFVRWLQAMEEGTGTAARDLANRTRGIASSVARVFQKPTGEDEILQPRVRSEMGHWVSHPHAIHVDAREGRITLTGDVLASEQQDLLRNVANVPGVKEVENRLRAHEDEGNIPAPRGGRSRESQNFWAPGPRLLAAISGAAMAGRGIKSGGLAGWSAAAAGAFLFARAATNMPLTRLLGIKFAAEEKQKSDDSGVTIPISRKEPKEYRIH